MDRDGKLSQFEKQRLITQLAQRQGRLGQSASACDVCGTNNWAIGDHLVQGHILRPNVGLAIGSPTYAYAQLICTNCGHTKFLNAYVVGLLDPNKPIQADREDGPA